MRLEQLKYIVAIADTGSISAASEKLSISQPSISQSLYNLERELNTVIFKRTRSGTQLTEVGSIIVQKSRDILYYIDSLAEAKASELTGSLTVSFIPSMGMSILPKTVGVFKDKYPGIRIRIVEEGSRLAAQNVLEDKNDIALVAQYKDYNYHEKLKYIPLMESRIQACIGTNSPFANRKDISLREIVQHPIVLHNEKYNIHSVILSLLKPYGEPNILYTSENFEVARRLIYENVAIGFHTTVSLLTDPYFRSRMILSLPIEEQTAMLSFSHGILVKKNPLNQAAIDKFIEELCVQANDFKIKYGICDALDPDDRKKTVCHEQTATHPAYAINSLLDDKQLYDRFVVE